MTADHLPQPRHLPTKARIRKTPAMVNKRHVAVQLVDEFTLQPLLAGFAVAGLAVVFILAKL